MPNPLEKSIKSAIRANGEIADSFARMGTKDHPRGFVLSAYRNARLAMTQVMQTPRNTSGAQSVIGGLRSTLLASLRTEFGDMATFGKEEAARQLAFYEARQTAQDILAMDLQEQVNGAVDAALAKLDAQEAAIHALLLTDASEQEIIGDADSPGVLRPSDVIAVAAYWAAALVWAGFEYMLTDPQYQGRFKKQAIAALDNRTTECCLRVHGQIQPLNGEFRLTGSPAYADRMDWSPFHARCRTSIALYDDVFDFGLTEAMRAGADQILAERAAGIYIDRHPSDGYG